MWRIAFVPAFVLLKSTCYVDGFQVYLSRRQNRPRFSTSLRETSRNTWMSKGLLISSFSDGLKNNKEAHSFLKESIEQALLVEHQQKMESQLESSVIASPCNGPDISFLDALDKADDAVGGGSSKDTILSDSSIRFLYIPTAMYALRPESQNTPGKQRQRARADGKKRRTEIASLLEEILNIPVSTITLDLDDGSLKQSNGILSDDEYPKTAKEALGSWNPHFVYIDGGNTFWLSHCVTKGKYDDSLRSLLVNPTTVYCGCSAGAILAGTHIETACWKGWDDPSIVPGMTDRKDWKGVAGLDLVGGRAFFPHMTDEYRSLVHERKGDLTAKVEAISDFEVLSVDGTTNTVQRLQTRVESLQ